MASPQLIWFTGMSEEEKERFLLTLQSSKALRDQLMKVLAHKHETIERKGRQESDYEDSNWVFKQAFNNGRLAMLNEVADLFNFNKE